MASDKGNSSDSSDELGLRLSFSSSSFDEYYSDDEQLDEQPTELDQGLGLQVQPYQYEPVAEAVEQPHEALGLEDDITTRMEIAVDEWCSCHKCQQMTTARECKCCKEIPEVAEKINAAEDENIQCICDHPGFNTVCLDCYVLETAYYEYRQRYGHLPVEDIHMRYRYVAYRQLVRWCWGYVGKNNRVVLPSCAVTKIRSKFQSPQYVWFKYPPLN